MAYILMNTYAIEFLIHPCHIKPLIQSYCHVTVDSPIYQVTVN